MNPADVAGQPDATLAACEDVNLNGTLETYGAGNLGNGFGEANGDPTLRVDCTSVARLGRVSGARHAVRLVNGVRGNLPTRPNGTGGFTLAGENPVYIQGDYNADAFGYTDPAAAAAVIADAVTLLSNSWADLSSFQSPTDHTGRAATTTWYRVAVAAGKNRTWSSPTWSTNSNDGLDGGTTNFMRTLENWAATQTLHFRGSLVSLFYSQYATGAYKCCQSVFSVADSDYSFDTRLLDLANEPPGAPRLQEVVTLGFRQIYGSP